MLSFIWTILKLTIEEFAHHKVRTFLSLSGIAIGIFCIISVQATTGSLENTIITDMKKVGLNTIFIQKMPFGGGGGPNSWWKYASRPNPKLEEAEFIEKHSMYARNVAFSCFNRSNVEYDNSVLENVTWYGITEDFDKVQELEIQDGRYISPLEFNQGSSVVVLGYENAVKLFEKPERALGKTLELGGYRAQVIGVTKKKGRNLLGGFDFDNVVLVSAEFCKRLSNFRRLDAFIMVQTYDGVPMDNIMGELRGIMRAQRRLSPKDEDNFSLNDVTAGSESLNTLFANINMGGWFIAFLSLLVGGFGIANIMFVSVRERTPIIGLKKAIGAKKSTILGEFLLESAFLCIIGGIIGLMLVFPMTFILTNVLKFNIYLSWGNILLTVFLCITIGILAGIIPASVAAKMDPVEAIRSK
jgi:putative ABC transport system permease protein